MNKSSWPLYSYRATVERVVDGDTISVLLDLGDRTYRTRRIRLLAYDAPELFSGTNRDAGSAARDALAALMPTGSTVYLRTELDRTSFDRLLARVYVAGSGDELLDVAEAMITAGQGVAR